jgi:hypothetical protein
MGTSALDEWQMKHVLSLIGKGFHVFLFENLFKKQMFPVAKEHRY